MGIRPEMAMVCLKKDLNSIGRASTTESRPRLGLGGLRWGAPAAAQLSGELPERRAGRAGQANFLQPRLARHFDSVQPSPRLSLPPPALTKMARPTPLSCLCALALPVIAAAKPLSVGLAGAVLSAWSKDHPHDHDPELIYGKPPSSVWPCATLSITAVLVPEARVCG